MSAYRFTQRAVASSDAPQKPLVRKRARSSGANWVHVTREKSPSKAKKPHKVQLTKQRNVDLTIVGPWAMPLNTGWVPVKVHRLYDGGKLKKCVPNHKHGGAYAPMESQPLWKGSTMRTNPIQKNE